MNIEEIMSRPVFSCRPNDTLNAAAQLMWEHDCGAVPVTDDEGRLVGMITDRDICMATYTKGAAPQAISVGEVMAKQVFSVRADDSLDAAERLMSDKRIRRVPVLDGDSRPIGFLSLGDIARYAAAIRKKDGQERAVVQTLAAVSEPRLQTV